jgi:hypothetical protein
MPGAETDLFSQTHDYIKAAPSVMYYARLFSWQALAGGW